LASVGAGPGPDGDPTVARPLSRKTPALERRYGLESPSVNGRWFVRGDIDGFFGLFVDNLLQLMLISVLSGAVCGLPATLVSGRILPGAAISILLGNVFYAWQA